LKGYDYRQAGTYFVTLCTYNRECLFGEVVDGEMHLNELGQIVHEEWLRSADIRPEMVLDAFVVMPNHLHGIIIITDAPNVGAHDPAAGGGKNAPNVVGAHGCAPLPPGRAPLYRQPRSLESFIAGFKSAVTKRINQIRQTPACPYGNEIITNT